MPVPGLSEELGRGGNGIKAWWCKKLSLVLVYYFSVELDSREGTYLPLLMNI